MKYLFLCAIVVVGNLFVSVSKEKPKMTSEDSLRAMVDMINASYSYQHGEVKLENGIATLQVPPGFKYLDAQQSKSVLTDVWGNPKSKSDDVLGMIFLENSNPLGDKTWAFVLSYEDIGYVSDEDADDINYDELLEQMREEIQQANVQQEKEGYATVSLVGWASPPYYDKNRRVLHWAKELKFSDEQESTLNYNVRALGRKGVMMLNAVGTMPDLSDVKNNIEQVLGMVQFSTGYKYEEYTSGVDKVAAYTLGGLVAGKVLAKVGFLAVLAKFAKFIVVGIAALGGMIWRFITGRSKQNDTAATDENPSPSDTGTL